jgi:hypothetical protein
MNGGLINMAIVVITSGSQGILHMPGYRQMIAGINNYTYRHALQCKQKGLRRNDVIMRLSLRRMENGVYYLLGNGIGIPRYMYQWGV